MKHNFIDISGRVFGLLVVIKYAGRYNNGAALWLCKCECGNTALIQGTHLRSGYYTSCGCYKKSLNFVHGFNKCANRATEYTTWDSMIQRCKNPNNTAFHKYGGRGINVCERWMSFRNFIDDMGLKPSLQHSIERLDNDGDYEPNNCVWADLKTQSRNKRTNHILTLNGKSQCLVKWAEELNLRPNTISTRLHRGWSVEKSLKIIGVTK